MELGPSGHEPHVSFQIERAGTSAAAELQAFATQRPLAYNDFASAAQSGGALPRTWVVRDDSQRIAAAALDDELAMVVAGDPSALAALGEHVGTAGERIAVSGRSEELAAFIGALEENERRDRPEWLMALPRQRLRVEPAPEVQLRVAEERDLEVLAEARRMAVGEEHGIDVVRGSVDAERIRSALQSAIAMRGVAIWELDGKVAFTAQLVARTPVAASFSDLYVDPDLRGEGRATRALGRFCAWLMDGSEHVTLRVGTDNDPAVRLYERLGFSIEDDFSSSLAFVESGDGTGAGRVAG